MFGTPGTPRDPFEKITDAAQVHAHTGLAPSVALHIPCDKVDDYAARRAHAEEHGVALGTINSNTFQDEEYKFGSLAASDPVARQREIDHHLACIEVMHETGLRGLGVFHGKRGWGVSVEFDVQQGPVTLLGLGQDRDGGLAFIASEGTVVPGPLLAIGNTTSRVDFGRDPGEWVDEWSATGIGHHWSLSIGHRAVDYKAAASLLGIDVRQV